MSNADFEAYLDTSDAWIVERTGIRERRRIVEGQTSMTLSAEASRRAMEDAGIGPDDLDLIVVATITPDRPLPSTACLLQTELGAKDIPAFDLAAACSGFVYGLVTAGNMLQSGAYKRALVVGVDCLTTITDYQDRRSCVLFGDAAGAAILEFDEGSDQRILHSTIGADGRYAPHMGIPAGGSALPASRQTVDERLHYMKMAGREVYKFAVLKLRELIQEAVDVAGVTLDDLAMIIPHQSNLRIIESAREKLGIPSERMYVNIDRYGNTSSGSIPNCLDEARRAGLIRRSDLVLLVAIGAGFTWASALLRL
jgi:3-oxoacyl-[acyl-carrier-protein] synthase-3